MYSFLFSNALIIRYSMQFGCPCFCRCTAHLGMPHLSMDVSVVWISSIFERYLQSLFSKSNLKIINLSVKPQLLFCFCSDDVKNKVVHTFYSLILFYRIELNLLELEPNRIESNLSLLTWHYLVTLLTSTFQRWSEFKSYSLESLFDYSVSIYQY